MPSYLLAAAWEKMTKDHQPASDAGPLTRLLKDYGKLHDEKNAEDQIPALRQINEMAISAKRKFKEPEIAKYLDEMRKEAESKKKEVEAYLKKEAATKKKGLNKIEKGKVPSRKLRKDLVLARILTRVRTTPAKSPLYFALALGRPYCGLVIARSISGSQRGAAIDARTLNNGRSGGSGIKLGRCYGEGGKVVFDMGLKPSNSTKPPASLALLIKSTIKVQTQGAAGSVKVICRGGPRLTEQEMAKLLEVANATLKKSAVLLAKGDKAKVAKLKELEERCEQILKHLPDTKGGSNSTLPPLPPKAKKARAHMLVLLEKLQSAIETAEKTEKENKKDKK